MFVYLVLLKCPTFDCIYIIKLNSFVIAQSVTNWVTVRGGTDRVTMNGEGLSCFVQLISDLPGIDTWVWGNQFPNIPVFCENEGIWTGMSRRESRGCQDPRPLAVTIFEVSPQCVDLWEHSLTVLTSPRQNIMNRTHFLRRKLLLLLVLILKVDRHGY